MGYRTVVMLTNDTAHHWARDPQLGQLISSAMHHSKDENNRLAQLRAGGIDYGRVVQCAHADEQTLVVLDAYQGFKALAHRTWRRDDWTVNVPLRLLMEAADAMGYQLVPKEGQA